MMGKFVGGSLDGQVRWNIHGRKYIVPLIVEDKRSIEERVRDHENGDASPHRIEIYERTKLVRYKDGEISHVEMTLVTEDKKPDAL